MLRCSGATSPTSRFFVRWNLDTSVNTSRHLGTSRLLDECFGDNALIENPMEDRGIELRLSVPVRRITLQIALDEY
jgi:hypothetical protein